jgi:hypothetical protein
LIEDSTSSRRVDPMSVVISSAMPEVVRLSLQAMTAREVKRARQAILVEESVMRKAPSVPLIEFTARAITMASRAMR